MLPDRFLEKIIYSESGHWLWTSIISPNGYGRYWFKGRYVTAHRFSWEHIKGVIEENKLVLHRNECHIRHCVNPDHCYIGTQKDNLRDALIIGTHPKASKTHCPQNHPYSQENTYIDGGYRKCKICIKQYRKESYIRAKIRKRNENSRGNE